MSIELDELPSHMRALAAEMVNVAAAIRYFGGFGSFAEYGELLETQSAPLLLVLAAEIEKRHGGRTQ